MYEKILNFTLSKRDTNMFFHICSQLDWITGGGAMVE